MHDFIKNATKDIISIEMLKYMAVGVFTVIIDVGIYTLCYKFIPLETYILTSLSTIISWVAATLFAFFANKIFVFNSRNVSRKRFWFEFLTFVGGRVVTLILSMVLLILMIDFWSLDYFWSKVIVNILVIIINYVVSKTLTFRKFESELSNSDLSNNK